MPRKNYVWAIEYLMPNGEAFNCKVVAKTIQKAIEVFHTMPGGDIIKIERQDK